VTATFEGRRERVGKKEGATVFVRKKTRKGGTYFYLVRCVRVKGGGVRQQVLCYLGDFPTVEAALAGLPGRVKEHAEQAARCRSELEGWGRSHKDWLKPGAEPGRPDGRRMPTWLCVALCRYWSVKEDLRHHERIAAEYAARLEKLKGALKCSAQN
jgi:hypothetical protein